MRSRFLLFSLCLLSCTISSAPSLADKLRVFAGSSPIFAPIFVADQMGFFKDEGLDVVVRPFASGAEATEGFRSGAAEFLVAADVPLIYVLAAGDTAMLAQFSANPDMLRIIGPIGLAGPEALRGKKVGIAAKSASEYMLNNYLARGGIKITEVERVNLAPFDQVSALVRGDVFALSTWTPFDKKIAQIAGNKYATASWNQQEGYIVFSGIVSKRDFAERKPEETAKVLKALIRASNYLSKTDVSVSSAAVARYLKTSPEDVQHVIANNRWDMAVDQNFISGMEAIEAFLAEQKFISKRVDWKVAYDWSFLKRVAPELVP